MPEMRTWYCVVSAYHDDGRVIAEIVNELEAEEKPENHFEETPKKDIYIDWFGSREEAEAFVKGARSA